MVDERSRADLMGLLYRLSALPGGSVLYDVAEIEVIDADDGTPSLGMPMLSGGGTLVVTPEPNETGRYAMLLAADDGVTRIANNVKAEDLFDTLTRRICPW